MTEGSIIRVDSVRVGPGSLMMIRGRARAGGPGVCHGDYDRLGSQGHSGSDHARHGGGEDRLIEQLSRYQRLTTGSASES